MRDGRHQLGRKGRGLPGLLRHRCARLLDGFDESKLLEGGYAIIEADLFNDLAVFDLS
jgi:hypothetical protein